MDEWKIIAELTDQNVLGTDGMSRQKPVKKARAILINEEGKYALMYEKKNDWYALPGGAIEGNEDEVAAVQREIREETGCTCDEIMPLGIVSENRFHSDSTRLSYFFVIHTQTRQCAPQLTVEEQELETGLVWCSLEKLLFLIRSANCSTPGKRFLQARDLAALHEYLAIR